MSRIPSVISRFATLTSAMRTGSVATFGMTASSTTPGIRPGVQLALLYQSLFVLPSQVNVPGVKIQSPWGPEVLLLPASVLLLAVMLLLFPMSLSCT